MVRDPVKNKPYENWWDAVQRGNCYFGFLTSTRGNVRANIRKHRVGSWQGFRVVCGVKRSL